ncbi:hypothetical protein CHS0354_015915 [Potamilus streckersoni]|uniref:Uncharacterized protein n=1 Tax=Potamilus streckersoni TaxID=2493646 RepID=A0AAE0VTU4_9BIVA|nr:hypothetical protein CHS0354_015915 [Potamilus streckersoni]
MKYQLIPKSVPQTCIQYETKTQEDPLKTVENGMHIPKSWHVDRRCYKSQDPGAPNHNGQFEVYQAKASVITLRETFGSTSSATNSINILRLLTKNVIAISYDMTLIHPKEESQAVWSTKAMALQKGGFSRCCVSDNPSATIRLTESETSVFPCMVLRYEEIK